MTLTLTLNDSQRVAPTGATLLTPAAVYEAARCLISLSQEHLLCFTLTLRHQVIACHTVSIGTVSASLIHPREVFRPALLDNASAIILCHNHPSGLCEPSPSDRVVTKQIAEAGELLGIELLDHVVVAEDGFRSLKET